MAIAISSVLKARLLGFSATPGTFREFRKWIRPELPSQEFESNGVAQYVCSATEMQRLSSW
jgi:hypothetical protein